ncbi:hypothetical protein [Exiguobacterium sp. SH0S7]|uniref:hypothetical protein n=1 Tax=Exiguobacterium sp. SH0S7 TaxID=2510951 RepID=UPI0013153815|nr:hypothetical protein [Exiguobacterium sp. SH0S7]
MIIKIDKSLIRYVTENSLQNNQDIIDGINSFLKLSYDEQHLVIIDLLVIDFLKENFENEIDKSCLQALSNIRNREVGVNKEYLRSFPIHINVTVDEEIKVNEVRVVENPYYPEGKIFEINIYSLCDYQFLGEKVSILSEYDTDVSFYSLIGKKFLHENYTNLKFKDNKINPGYGGNIKKAIEVAVRNQEKTLIICDTDKKAENEPLGNGCTLENVEIEYKKFKDSSILHLLSLDAHEKENLIPASWLQELNMNRTYCVNVLNLENTEFSDRLLFLDFKEGLTKEKYHSSPIIKKYYDPAIQVLGIDLNSLQDKEYIFSKIHSKRWDDYANEILNKKELTEFPDYLKDNINKLGLFISCWIVSGRKDTNKAKQYIL